MTKHQLPSRGPDYGIAKILRGYKNFEDIYQGMPLSYPIALSLYGSQTGGRDPQAQANYQSLSAQLNAQVAGPSTSADAAGVDGATSPNLIAGVPTVFGANAVFGIPRSLQPDLTSTYVFKIIWRIRTIDLFAKTQNPYHAVLNGYRYTDGGISTAEGWGATPPVFGGKAAQRASIATFEETIRFTHEPASDATSPERLMGQQTALDLCLQPSATYAKATRLGPGGPDALKSPLLPFVGGKADVNLTTNQPYVIGDVGQDPLTGVYTVSGGLGPGLAATIRNNISHVTYSTVAKGDECVVLVYPRPLSFGEVGTYNFDDVEGDLFFSFLFGRGGYKTPEGQPAPLLPNGAASGVYLIQGFS